VWERDTVVKIGIGVPTTIEGVTGDLLIEWARQADAAGFSSLSFIDRIAYANFELMATLGAMAAVTKNVRLLPAVILGPTRSAGLLAKQATTIDQLSNGRLSLGLGIGHRPQDYEAAGQPFKTRGQDFDTQLETLRRVWRGEPFSESTGPIGPPPVQPGGPELLIGAFAPAALTRVARYADGYIGVRTPADMATAFKIVEDGWRAAGRAGRPRFVGLNAYALGPDAEARSEATVRPYYSYWPERVDFIVNSTLTTPAAIREFVQACADIGVDEVLLNPTIADLDQIARLREVI
jgi:alkanesulfonate monooxygenase SsuD/methylene tetrahydromethanopterin reductase-like flavin-dependent oxidoreductase (luciferase family)